MQLLWEKVGNLKGGFAEVSKDGLISNISYLN